MHPRVLTDGSNHHEIARRMDRGRWTLDGDGASQALPRPRILLVDDDALLAKSTAKHLSNHAGVVVVVALTFADARHLLVSGAWDALVVDIELRDREGCGFDLIALARLRELRVPVILVTGELRIEFVNKAHALGAELVTKPYPSELLVDFARRATRAKAAVAAPTSADASRWTFAGLLERAITAWASRYQLSPAMTDVLRLAANGHDRQTIATLRGTSENTVKNQIVAILARTGDDSLQGATVRLLREAVLLPSRDIDDPHSP